MTILSVEADPNKCETSDDEESKDKLLLTMVRGVIILSCLKRAPQEASGFIRCLKLSTPPAPEHLNKHQLTMTVIHSSANASPLNKCPCS